jgi:hypothetical protein
MRTDGGLVQSYQRTSGVTTCASRRTHDMFPTPYAPAPVTNPPPPQSRTRFFATWQELVSKDRKR